jgi:hypothetical protein
MKTETCCVDPGLSSNSGVTTTVAWPVETADVMAEAVVVDHAAVEVILPTADVVVIAAVLVKLMATRVPQPPLLLPRVVVVVAVIVVEELEVIEPPYLTVSTLQELEPPKLF